MVSIDALPPAVVAEVEEVIPSVEIKQNSNPIYDTIQVNVDKQTYQDLPFSKEDKEHIAELITAMGLHSKIFLLWHSRKYYKIGDKINHVHPLKFLGVIYSNPELKEHMKEIMNDYFKRKNLINGLVPHLDEMAKRKNFTRDFTIFCEEIQVPFDSLKEYMKESTWKDMVDYLTDR